MNEQELRARLANAGWIVTTKRTDNRRFVIADFGVVRLQAAIRSGQVKGIEIDWKRGRVLLPNASVIPAVPGIEWLQGLFS